MTKLIVTFRNLANGPKNTPRGFWIVNVWT